MINARVLGLLLPFLFMAAPNSAQAIEYKTEAICDKAAGFCADWMGVSVALTKMYLGEEAEAKLMATINTVGISQFDATEFTMTGGLTCHTKEQLCWTTRLRQTLDKKAINTLFGQVKK